VWAPADAESSRRRLTGVAMPTRRVGASSSHRRTPSSVPPGASTKAVEEGGTILRTLGGFVDAEGFARHADGRALSDIDACGALNTLHVPASQSAVTVSHHTLGVVTSKWSYKFFQ